MAIKVNFRVVGVYCFFKDLQLEDVNPDSTVAQVMEAIKAVRPSFNYISATLDRDGDGDPSNDKEIMYKMLYKFNKETGSVQPPNTFELPEDGFRDLDATFAAAGGDSNWQYYRSVTGTLDGKRYTIQQISPGQPSHAKQPLNADLQVPEGFAIETYNLTWRLLRIQMKAENRLRFMEAYVKAMKKELEQS